MALIATPKKKPRKNFVRLKSIGTKWRDVRLFRDDLFNRVGDRLFYIPDKVQFLYEVLKEIHPVNKGLKPNPQSIEDACEKVMIHFGFHKLKALSVKEHRDQKNGIPESSTDQFMKSVLMIERVPYSEFYTLNSYVKGDLLRINELINWYEGEPCIRRFMAKAEVPTDLEERTKFDFYQRCVRERGVIISFQLNSLKKRVLAKVQAYSQLLGALVLHDRYDRPYKFARPEALSYFDCREMDLAKHRLNKFYIDEVDDMVAMYRANKPRFYRTYFKRIPWRDIFRDCLTHLQYLPLGNDRVPIFKELLSLFKGRRWMAFYALGLPQVEGLFSEMCDAINPNGDHNKQGLSKKVFAIRSHYNDYFDNLDYYQYHIPLQRNRFAHTGHDEDFQLKSYDLIVDLEQVLTVFSDLNHPFVKVIRLHKRKNTQDFSSLEQFVEYFNLIESLNSKQREKLAGDILNFETAFLGASTEMIYMAKEVSDNFLTEFNAFVEDVNNNFQYRGTAFDLSDTNQAKIESLAKVDDIRSLLITMFTYPNDHLDKLIDYYHFLSGFVNLMTTGDTELRSAMKSLYSKYGKRLSLIEWIRQYAKQFDDD